MCSVIVVGAGAAGMTAAYDIKRQSECTVKVLECLDRHGGRLKKDDELADFGIDLGGEWIDSVKGIAILDQMVDDPDVDIDVETFTFDPPWFWWFEIFNKFIKVVPANDFGPHFKGSTYWDFFDDYIVKFFESI